MMEKSGLDMSRPNALYGAGLAFAVLLSLVVSNVPQAALSHYVHIPFRKNVAIALFGVGAFFAMVTVQRYMARVKFPWKIPQSQVSILYLLSFAGLISAIALSH